MEEICAFVYSTSLGDITVACSREAVVGLWFGRRIPEGAAEKETLLSARCYAQICEYLRGERREFDLPLAPKGTEFQRKVWCELTAIGYGETQSYGELAAKIGSPKAARAVGMANHKNPISILIPCHRVVGKNGGLTGYAGGLERKEILLKLERRCVKK